MLERLFGSSSKKPAANNLGPSLAPGIAESILSTLGARSIPTMPGAAQKAFQLSTDPNAEARDFIEVIESDESLSARVLKIANSVYFDRGKSTQTIEEAVLVIGITELRSLLSATTLSEIFPSQHPARTQLWANDIATALIAKHLAQIKLPTKTDAAFLGGLMHDLGKLLLLQRSPEEYGKVLKMVESQGMDFCQAEYEQFVFSHTEVGLLVAQRWNFGPELQSVICDHHKPWQELCVDRACPLSALIKAADIIAHSLGLGHKNGFTRLRNRATEELGELANWLAIEPDSLKALLEQGKKAFDLEFDLYAGKSA